MPYGSGPAGRRAGYRQGGCRKRCAVPGSGRGYGRGYAGDSAGPLFNGIRPGRVKDRAVQRYGGAAQGTIPGQRELEQKLVARIDPGLCTGCGLCATVCPAGAIAAGPTAVVDPRLCQGCGTCTEQCPQGAISLVTTTS